MFRSKRSVLIRRLWRSRVIGGEHGPENITGSTAEPPASPSSTSTSRSRPVLRDRDTRTTFEPDQDFKSAAHSFLKKLKDHQLELLLEAVEGRGNAQTSCVLFPKGEIRLGRGRTVLPHVLCCQLYRWPDLRHDAQLKRLQYCCQTHKEKDPDASGTVCCNPYHLSRLCRPESPPPPYSRFPLERQKEEDSRSLLSTTSCSHDFGGESTETGNTPTARLQPYDYVANSDMDGDPNRKPQRHWCHVAYWEHRSRTGRMFAVYDPSVNIFYELPHGDGFCLGLLNRDDRSESVKRTRTKIGCGLTLFKEDDGVWAYNRSQHALFVNSPTLDLPQSRTLTVHKLQPGYSMKIYDWIKSEILEMTRREPEPPDGPTDPNAVRISFIKGWGPRYSRQFITSCPCWIEVILSKPR